MRVLAAGLLLFLAGCIETTAQPTAVDVAELPKLTWGGVTVTEAAPLHLNLSLDVGAAIRMAFVATPAPGAGELPGVLEFSIRWGLYEDRDFDLRVAGPQGTVNAMEPDAAIGARSLQLLAVPGSAAVALFPNAEAGQYVVEVEATQKGGPLEFVAQIDAPIDALPLRDLLPNLITLPPMDLGIRDPEGVDAATRFAGVKGCRADEAAEMGARRCMRFSNGIANIGEGPLEMRLPLEDGVRSPAAGRFVQRIERSDGSTYDRDAGVAAFHANHGHYHYTGVGLFEVFAFDESTHERGERVAKSVKTGFCFADLNLAEMGLPHTRGPRFDASGCFDPTVHEAWTTGLNPNWYDRYHWSWFEQYVDLQGVADGVYELVSTANAEGSILEWDATDNVASVVFRLTGDGVEVLET